MLHLMSAQLLLVETKNNLKPNGTLFKSPAHRRVFLLKSNHLNFNKKVMFEDVRLLFFLALHCNPLPTFITTKNKKTLFTNDTAK